MRELIRRNRDEMQDRRRAGAKRDHNPLGTRTYTLAVRDEEENNYDSNDEEAGIPRGGIEDSSDEEEGIQRGGIEDSSDEEAGIQRGGIEDSSDEEEGIQRGRRIEDSSDEEEGIQRGGIEEEVNQNDCLSENAAETDDNAAPKIALKKTGGGGEGGEEACVSARTTLAMEPAARAETRDHEEIELNTLKSHETGANNDAQEFIVTVDVHVPRVDAAYPDVEMAPAPVKRKLQKNGSKTRKIGKTVSGGKGKAAADTPGVKPSDQAGNTGMDRKIGANRSDEGKGAVDIRVEELSGQAGSSGRSQQTGAGRGNKKNAAPAYPAQELSCQAEDNGIDPKMGAANEGKEITPTSSVGAVHDGSGLQASMAEEGFSAIKKRSNWKRRVNLAGNARKKP